MEEIAVLRIATLLHDIGKFWQGTGRKENHAELSARFIRQYLPQFEKAASLAASHHDYEKIYGKEFIPLKILVVADWLASGERIEYEEGEERGRRIKTPMLSIFSEVRLEGKEKAVEKYLVPTIYDPTQPVYPTTETRELIPSYKALWDSFLGDIQKIKIENAEELFETLFYLLKKYCLFIPAAVYKTKPDISLFDHAKTTCAIAECLYKVADPEYLDTLINALRKIGKELDEKEEKAIQEEKFLLIGGDISGIQKFIYTIISEKAVKNLKGRSFHLQLLSEIIARHIIKRLDLSIANIIYCAGGHFYILAPLSEETEKEIENIRKDISSKLFNIYNGRLYLAIDYISLTPKDFLVLNGKVSLAEKWKELSEKLNIRKRKRFEEIIEEDVFKPIEAKKICKMCNFPIIEDEEDEICELCKGFKELVEAKKKFISIRETKEIENGWNKPFSYFGYSVSFDKEVDSIIVYKINDTSFDEINYPLGFSFSLDTKLQNLDELAEKAEGLERWGVIRGDVDNLGRIFSEGLENPTLSRLSTLSTMISFFFSGKMNVICNRENYKDKIYGVYSGGDDFFLIAPWNILPELAKEIYTEFRKFTGENPSITLSMAISIAPSVKYPVYKIADIVADELESKAKASEKNSLVFLGKRIEWDEFDKIIKVKNELRNAIKNGVSKGFLQKLYSIYWLYKKSKDRVGEELAKYDNRYGKWRWLLAYILAREKGIKEKEKWKKLIVENIDYLDVIVRWVEFLERGGDKG